MEAFALYELFSLAREVAARYHLKCPLARDIARNLNEPAELAPPVLTRCKNGLLWVDRGYIAYCLQDDRLCYVYLSRRFILEELRGFREAAAARGRVPALSPSVLIAYRRALNEMKLRKTRCWIDPQWERQRAGLLPGA